MNEQINEHDMVALLNDMPDEQVYAGDVGAVVYVHGEGDRAGEAFEVEFANPDGDPRYRVVTVKADDLLKLRHFGAGVRWAG